LELFHSTTGVGTFISVSVLSILEHDGDCFFDETFVPETLHKVYPKAEINFAEASQVLKKLREAVEASPTAYYALIQMDGNHIGTIINGVKEQIDHREISMALSDFARKRASEIVEKKEHPGKLVYAGGDDMIAFSPLIGLLNMVDALQDQYRQVLGEKATASVGIAIAHHTTPLSLVRQAAFEAVHLAKERYGRNALVVTIMRRSGEQTRVGCHWKYKGLQPLALFGEFYRLLISDQLSESSIHVLIDEAPALIGLKLDAQKSEIKRILQRKQHGQNDQADENSNALPNEKAKDLAERVVRLTEAMDKAMDKEQADDKEAVRAFELEVDALRVGLVEVLGWLLVMAFLAREEHHLDTDARERNHVQ
jgi:CRISPR-associated protein Cmr2